LTNRTSTLAKLLVVVVPLVLMLASITVYQIYFSADPPANQVAINQNTRQLQIVGYSNSSEPSLTLTNAGNKQLTILQVAYDGKPLIQGVLGGAMPMFAVNNNSSFCEVPTNYLIFPQAQHWNMDNGGLCTATILPRADATLYLGVYSNTNSSHVLQIVTDEGNYTFAV
jgi:hypothetical protein